MTHSLIENDSETSDAEQRGSDSDSFFQDDHGPAIGIRTSDGNEVILTYEDLILLMLLGQVLLALWTTYTARKS